ncbi:DUF5709 domain-containing protein [Streptomyces sp. NPDC058691]|uniref:DUF5709 domain-containing protein n=1 Tax=Streptomyces sp. NPDC058691 TaxID=3346601 RepID=UPI003649D2D1
MSDDPMADDVYQPTGDDEEQQDATSPDLEDALGERDYDDILDEGYSPPERPLGLDKVGVTAAEQRAGETLDERLAQEVPDDAVDPGDDIGDLAGGDGEPVDPQAGGERAGRLVAPDAGTGEEEDIDSDLLARDVGIDAGAAGAEEAAVHIVPEDDPWE